MGEIVQGLFGLTPYQVQQQQYGNLQNRAAQYAELDPFQRAAQTGYNAGGMLAGAGADAFGGVNVEQEQAARQQAMLQGLNNDPQSLRERALQIQDPQLKIKLGMLADQIEGTKADLALKKAHADYYSKGGASGGSSQKLAKLAIARNDALKAGLNGGLSGQDLMNFINQQVEAVSALWDQQSPSAITDNSTIPLSNNTSIAGNLSVTKQEKDALIADATARGDAQAVEQLKQLPVKSPAALLQSKASVAGSVKLAETQAANNPDALAGGAAAKKTGEQGAELNMTQYQNTIEANNNLNQIKELKNQLNSSSAITGMGADLIKGFYRAQAALGGKDAAKKASDTEILDVMMGSEVFPLIKSLGIGAKGMDTPAEREFMRKVLTGEISLNKETLLKMADMREKIAQRNIDQWNERVGSGELDNFFTQTGRKKTVIGQTSNKPLVGDTTKPVNKPTVSNW